MNIVSKLQQALINQDWDLVKEVYVDLGGDLGGDSDRKRLRGERKLAVMLDEESEISNEASDSENKKKRIAIGKRLKIGQWVNNFKDDGKEAKKDKVFDKKVWKGKKPVQRRPPAKKIDVECDLCKKICKVYPKDIPPSIGDKGGEGTGYKCDKCLGSK